MDERISAESVGDYLKDNPQFTQEWFMENIGADGLDVSILKQYPLLSLSLFFSLFLSLSLYLRFL